MRKIDGEHLPRVAAEIPWHSMVLIFKLKGPPQRPIDALKAAKIAEVAAAAQSYGIAFTYARPF